MTELNSSQSKSAKSQALTRGLWTALGIAFVVSVLWLGIEGGIRLYHRPAKLDTRVAELESRLASVQLQENQLQEVLKGSLESEKILAPVAGKLAELISKVGQLPMNALPSSSTLETARVAESKGWADRIFQEIKKIGDRLVRIQVVGDTKDVALTPAAQDLIRQQVRLHLVSARLAWLSRMPQVCKDDLQAVDQLLAKHFQAQAPAVVSMQKALADLQKEIAVMASPKKGS